MTNKRLTRLDLPPGPTPCPMARCVYNKAGICPYPRTAKYNSDSACYRWTNKRLLAMLGRDTDGKTP